MAFRWELEDFREFYQRTYPGAFWTSLAIVRDAARAADVAQEAYVLACTKRASLRGDGPGAGVALG